MLFGQAKRYVEYSKITLDMVKSVEPTWADILRRKLDGNLPQHLEDGLAAVGWAAGDAVRLMYVTTSGFTEPALEYVRAAGMITLDGEQLTQLLLDDEQVVNREGDGSYVTSRELLAAFCAG